ncbi:MAG TPA: spore coat protein [Clostridia bacterium]|nr:spore coat protein [Clostridia bacterium]
MPGIIQNLVGMGDITEQVIATDFLIAVKAGVRNYAMAISEAITPEVKDVLRRHLDAAIETHEKVTDYMIRKGYYHTYDFSEQLRVDFKAADTVLNMQ